MRPEKEGPFHIAVREWNRKKSMRNFMRLYRDGFYYMSLWQNPLWRVYRIIKDTLTGKYLWCEKELDRRDDREDY